MSISKSFLSISSFFLVFSCSVWSQENPAGKNKSEVHIKTIKIENGDTLIEENVFIDDIPSVNDSSYRQERVIIFSDGHSSDSIIIFKEFENCITQDMNELGNHFDMLFADPFFGSINFLDHGIAMCLDTAFRNLELKISDSVFPWYDKHLYLYFHDDFPDDDDVFIPNPNKETYESETDKYEKKIIIIDDDAYYKSGNSDSEAGIQGVEIYPNPTSGEFNLSFMLSKSKKSNIEIIDPSGKIVHKETINMGKGLFTKQFNMTPYGKGSYYIKLTQGKESISQMIIVR